MNFSIRLLGYERGIVARIERKNRKEKLFSLPAIKIIAKNLIINTSEIERFRFREKVRNSN